MKGEISGCSRTRIHAYVAKMRISARVGAARARKIRAVREMIRPVLNFSHFQFSCFFFFSFRRADTRMTRAVAHIDERMTVITRARARESRSRAKIRRNVKSRSRRITSNVINRIFERHFMRHCEISVAL